MTNNKINRYCLAFPFRGEYHYIYVMANEMANELLGSGDDVLDFKSDENLGQSDEHHLSLKGKRYSVAFSFDGPTKVDVFTDDGLEETIVERGIPYVCVAVDELQEDGRWTRIYNLSDNV